LSSHIAWFDAVRIEDRPRVGGKGASLGELRRAGIDVPPGFVVTTDAFRHFAAGEGTRREREALEAAAIPETIASAVARAYAALCDEAAAEAGVGAEGIGAETGAGARGLPVAVRSSATSEDAADASFAGLQDTYLWVRGDSDVLAALRRCWASLYSESAVAYRARLALRDDDIAMGVVIQRMVNPRAAGVMFTRSPQSGDPSVVAICASYGLGSAVVGGEVTPDEFVVNKVTGVVQKTTISDKALRHVPSDDGSGTREEPVPEALRSQPALDAAELSALTEIGRRIEKHYGCAQDIEWAVDAGGRIFVLQSRPETVWNARDRATAATPKATSFEHVLSFFGTKRE
jgi:pyruvate,water dikinase